MFTRKKLLMLVGVLAIFCLFSYSAKTGTVAWFVSETSVSGSLVNAKTDDLVDVASTVVSCSEEGVAHVEVTATSKHVSVIPIRLGDVQKEIVPGESVSVQISKHISGETERVVIPFIGFDYYIDEMIEIPLGQKCLETVTGSENKDPNEEDESDAVQDGAMKTEDQRSKRKTTAKQKQLVEDKETNNEKDKLLQQEEPVLENEEAQEKARHQTENK